jgi:hypothetical protein
VLCQTSVGLGQRQHLQAGIRMIHPLADELCFFRAIEQAGGLVMHRWALVLHGSATYDFVQVHGRKILRPTPILDGRSALGRL